MARRSDYTRDELREMAIKSGIDIIKKEGLNGFSARKVAREIGYTIGTIYNIFESHDDFILHINAVTLCNIADFLEKMVIDKNEAAIKQLAEGYIEFASSNYNLWSALFEHHIPSNAERPEWYQAHIKRLFNIVEKHFEQIVLNKKEAEIAAKTIWAGIHGICLLSLTGKLDTVGARSMKVLTDSLVDNYLMGLRA